jgi:pimeloyl-ACP methyl ester carboxylesterase
MVHFSKLKLPALLILLFVSIPLPAGENKYSEPGRETAVMDSTVRARKGGTYVTLSEGVTHYELSGPEEGDIVVLIHGASLAMWVWDRQVDALAAAGFRVLRYDQYGRGLSDYLRTTYDRELYRKQLFELLDSLGINKPVSFVVHSFGGFIGSYFTYNHPGRVDKIVFIAPGVTVGPIVKFIVKSHLGKWIIHNNLEKLPKTIGKKFQEQKIPIDPYKKMYFEQVSYKGFEASMISLFAYAIDDYLPYYRKIGKENRKVMLIWGSGDNTAKEKDILKAKKVMPQVTYIRLEGVGHVPQFEATDTLNAMLVNFLRSGSE